ncbi:MAG TPA: HIT family protein [Planctomycetota bacterium]|nr:HIT family protein [Planctomycetota bacterium]
MADCIFCKILKGEIAAQKVYEDEKSVAILDINPVAPGHALVMPRGHFETFSDLPPDVLSALSQAAQAVARGVMKATGSPGFNLLMNNHRCSGQAIAHAHYHVIPRKPDDGVKYNWPAKAYPQPGDSEKVAGEIRKALGK